MNNLLDVIKELQRAVTLFAQCLNIFRAKRKSKRQYVCFLLIMGLQNNINTDSITCIVGWNMKATLFSSPCFIFQL